jgi:hypothetical protein
VLNAEFDIVEHQQLADPDTNQIFSEYVKGKFRERDPYLAHNMKGTTLISFSMPTNLSSLSNRDVVPVLGIFLGSHAISMGTVQALFGNIRGLTAQWGELRFGPGEASKSLHAHPALLAFLHGSSLGGINPSLSYRVDYMGVSDTRQPTTSKTEERGRAWRFEAMIDVAHHKGPIDAQGDIFSDYFCLHILQGITNWETIFERFEPWDLVCYSVPRNIGCLQTRDSVPVPRDEFRRAGCSVPISVLVQVYGGWIGMLVSRRVGTLALVGIDSSCYCAQYPANSAQLIV